MNTLSKNFKSLEELIYAFSNLDKVSLPECEGLGKIIINSLQSYFLNQKK